jgi:pyruvate dehydrogenase E2 component (dihydrolipoamide acetyltransferase)
MADVTLVRVPDIGDFEDVEVVEILVGPGDRVELEDSLVSIESDKATMEIPSPVAGEVGEVHVSLGSRVSEGSPLLEIRPLEETDDIATADAETAAPEEGSRGGAADRDESSAATGTARADEEPSPTRAEAAPSGSDARAAHAPGSRAKDTPAPEVESAGESALRPGDSAPRRPPVAEEAAPRPDSPHASPLVRRFARELGVDLQRPRGSGPQGRILPEDVKAYVRDALGSGGGESAADESPPAVDAERFGPVHEEPLGRIRRVSARNLSRSWRTAPHVTQHDEADVTELEAFRKTLAEDAQARGVKLSPLHFVMKAVAIALRDFPDMRSSLSPDGERLIVKDYVHLGIAVDTEHGLVVPVVRDVDRKGLYGLADELAVFAEKARARRLGPADMQGASFTISSLGGIGGTAFSPIVNVPEVALLGLSKLSVKPVWNAGLDVGREDGRFEPRITLPLSLSYDHRVIDGAVAVRFTTRLVRLLSHPAHLLL